MLKTVLGRTFNRISVDSDTSTNDTVLLLANGASGVAITRANRERFESALGNVAESLAVAIARDGEGARKLLTIDVEGAASERAADTIARAIANSPLVKTAIAGADPNWGRFLSSAGASGVDFEPSKVDIHVNGFRVCRRRVAARISTSRKSRRRWKRTRSTFGFTFAAAVPVALDFGPAT